ncbi:uncharacterized protein LOC125489646 [Plutella xylostella]|uniref:uncharacterized protein LOC125489646 n=1 Tax=Plutella xylostella TaxID=51655 RepID=UPI00203299EB|nr:uncharacterized protein LOC125489646 [Plutella xylostella]
MGIRKRSKDREYEKIMRKLRKLEEKTNKRRRIISSSSSDSEASSNPDLSQIPVNLDDESSVSEEIINEPRSSTEVIGDEPSLNPDILEMLGDDPLVERTFGEDLHKDIANRWQHILLNGLHKETKSDLLKTYLPAQNCPNMQAPKLNLEVKAALNEIDNKKDMYSQGKQRHLSSCLAAVGKALNIALAHTDPVIREIIKPLSDAGRMICDFHYRESQSRRYSIINTLNKQTRDTVKNTKIDEYLFGSELADHLKSSKAISRSGYELKQTRNLPPRARQPVASTVVPVRRALNARGPPRMPAAAAEPSPRQAAPRYHQAPAPPPPPPPAPRHRQRETATAPRTTYYQHRNQRTRR